MVNRFRFLSQINEKSLELSRVLTIRSSNRFHVTANYKPFGCWMFLIHIYYANNKFIYVSWKGLQFIYYSNITSLFHKQWQQKLLAAYNIFCLIKCPCTGNKAKPRTHYKYIFIKCMVSAKGWANIPKLPNEYRDTQASFYVSSISVVQFVDLCGSCKFKIIILLLLL